MDSITLAELAKFSDSIPFRASKNHTHNTWARTFYSSPELYIRPRSVEEIQKAVTLARRCRKRITMVGCGHSPSDLTCTSSWMMNLDDFNKILSVDQEKCTVVMQAGIRLYQLGDELDKVGLAMPNLGSINSQSIAGAISTATHGSTLQHGILSESILSLRITLSNGKTVLCSASQNPSLFRASLVSLGALGIITELTFRAVPAFSLSWTQAIHADNHIFSTWDTTLWTSSEFVRVWWFPYTRRATVWRADKTTAPSTRPPASYYDAWLGYHVYHNLLALAQRLPRILPWVEWFVFGMQYGFRDGSAVGPVVQPSRRALLMNCLYSQFVNEWALPLRRGPEALRRLSSWLNRLAPGDRDYVPHGIPFANEGLYVHAPVEVRVADTTLRGGDGGTRPYLDSSVRDGPTLYLNATLYRPYDADPPCRARYYEAFEWLMREMGGKPHWAKNFETGGAVLEEMYGAELREWRQVRAEADPEGMFVGAWHREHVLGGGPERFALEEVEVGREKVESGGVRVLGVVDGDGNGEGDGEETEGESEHGPRPPSSEESFDVMHGAEATESVIL